MIKLLMIGDSGVGKSCLVLRFCEDSFTPTFIATTGIDFRVQMTELNGKRVKLQIWDTAGQERYRTIAPAYYKGAHGILLVYDVTDEKSFLNIRNWMKSIEQHAPDTVKRILIGNKSDMVNERVIDKAKGQGLADEYNIKFFECSAKSNQNVEDSFLELALQSLEDLESPKSEEIVAPSVDRKVKKCC